MSNLNQRVWAGLTEGVSILTLAATVTVVCRLPGIRRNGVRHPASKTYPADRWTVEELQAFEADPAFTVYFDAPAVAPGADTADAVQDNGAGAPVPDLGAKPDGTGPSAAISEPDGTYRPPVFDNARIEAVRGRFVDLGIVFAARHAPDPGAVIDFTQTTEEEWAQVETLVGFRPTIAEMQEVIRLDGVARQTPPDLGQPGAGATDDAPPPADAAPGGRRKSKAAE